MRQLLPHETAERPRYQSHQQEAVAAAFAFSQLEAAVSGVPCQQADAEAIGQQGMAASTSGTTVPTKHGGSFGQNPGTCASSHDTQEVIGQMWLCLSSSI